MKKGTLNDQMNITKDMSNVGHHANGDYAIDITNEEDIDNAMLLVKQSFKINKK